MPQYFHYNFPFTLESGAVLPSVSIAFETYGTLNENSDNVVWACHALTANANVSDWWPGMVGEKLVIDTKKYFVVCANILGSCYGSTGPLEKNSDTGISFYHGFPKLTIRDMVAAHILLRKHLLLETIHLLFGGSMGGYQVLEWAIMEKNVVKNIFIIATSAAESAWGIAIHTAQRVAIEADNSWLESKPDAGLKGLKAARAIGMLSYRNYSMYEKLQKDPDNNKLDNYKASFYIIYQGEKLVRRFNAFSYYALTKTMDTHNISRGRTEDVQNALKLITQPVLLMGISSDILCPKEEQEFMAKHLPAADYHIIDSEYGHDGFLLETEKITAILKPWLDKKSINKPTL